MGGKASMPSQMAAPSPPPAPPSMNDAERQRLAKEQDLADKDAKRKKQIAQSGRAATILAGEQGGTSAVRKLLGE